MRYEGLKVQFVSYMSYVRILKKTFFKNFCVIRYGIDVIFFGGGGGVDDMVVEK
jgi:hypothetical protein